MRKKLSLKDQYLQKLFSVNDAVLNRIEAELKTDDKWGINLTCHELSILKFLIESLDVVNILEVGTLYGYSTYGMAKFLPDGGLITSIEKNEKNYEKAKELIQGSPEEKKIKLIHKDALDYLKTCENKFDLIFIDANKSGYLNYLELGLDLLKPKGVIVGDNTFLFGLVYGEDSHIKMSDKNVEIMKIFNSKYVHESGYTCTLIPTTEGMTLIKKNKS